MTRYIYESRELYDDIDNVYADADDISKKLEDNKYLNTEDRDRLIEALWIIRKLRENKD